MRILIKLIQTTLKPISKICENFCKSTTTTIFLKPLFLKFSMEYLLTETGIALGQAIALWVDKKIKRTYWTNEQIDKWFGKRSIKEIIEEETTCFMNPCFDLTLVSSYLLTQNKIKNDVVIEEHLPTNEFNFNRLHFALNFTDGTGEYYLNYKNKNFAYINAGKYSGRKDISQAQLIKISGEIIDSTKPLYENLNKNIKTGFSLEKCIKRLKQDNSLENYNQYRQKCGERFVINQIE